MFKQRWNNFWLSFTTKEVRDSFKNINMMMFLEHHKILKDLNKKKAVIVDRIVKSAPKPKYRKILPGVEIYEIIEENEKKTKNRTNRSKI